MGRWDAGRKVPGRGRSTGKDSGRVKIPGGVCRDGPRRGICLGGKECFATNIAWNYQCMVTVESRLNLTLNFLTAFKFSTDNLLSYLCMPRTDHSHQPLPFVMPLVTGFVGISSLEMPCSLCLFWWHFKFF